MTSKQPKTEDLTAVALICGDLLILLIAAAIIFYVLKALITLFKNHCSDIAEDRPTYMSATGRNENMSVIDEKIMNAYINERREKERDYERSRKKLPDYKKGRKGSVEVDVDVPAEVSISMIDPPPKYNISKVEFDQK